MHEVAGKVAFVTGGSSGIGLGIASAFAGAGMKVAIGYRTPEHLDQALEKLHHVRERIHPIDVDVTDRLSMEAAVAQITRVFDKIHVLVSNAGVTHSAPLSQTTYDDWDWLMSINLNGVFNSVRAFLPAILAHGEGGHVIATASVLGLFAVGNYAAYSASKFAVVGLMEALRVELANTSVGVSVFCPGVVASNIADSARNRPSELGRRNLRSDAGAHAAARSRDAQGAMDFFEAGRLVLRGMRNNDLYILSHAEHEPIMRQRSDALLGSLPADLPVTDTRLAVAQTELYTRIYALERNRKQKIQH
jgi:NAD(P)-dependent dehydrogenase (short-subunit alcohol dehydrogenase family)